MNTWIDIFPKIIENSIWKSLLWFLLDVCFLLDDGSYIGKEFMFDLEFPWATWWQFNLTVLGSSHFHTNLPK